MKSLRFARLGLHSFWEVDFTMCVCYCRLTLLGLLGFCELYFADLILSLLISSWLECTLTTCPTRLSSKPSSKLSSSNCINFFRCLLKTSIGCTSAPKWHNYCLLLRVLTQITPHWLQFQCEVYNGSLSRLDPDQSLLCNLYILHPHLIFAWSGLLGQVC